MNNEKREGLTYEDAYIHTIYPIIVLTTTTRYQTLHWEKVQDLRTKRGQSI
jgi:hypothetical protein